MHFVVVLAAASSRVSYSMTERFAEPVMCSVAGRFEQYNRAHPRLHVWWKFRDSTRTILLPRRGFEPHLFVLSKTHTIIVVLVIL
ncbi:hypothetical protein B0H14DRAFT_2877855, partial [Mycena olivaceomarginata]